MTLHHALKMFFRQFLVNTQRRMAVAIRPQNPRTPSTQLTNKKKSLTKLMPTKSIRVDDHRELTSLLDQNFTYRLSDEKSLRTALKDKDCFKFPIPFVLVKLPNNSLS